MIIQVLHCPHGQSTDIVRQALLVKASNATAAADVLGVGQTSPQYALGCNSHIDVRLYLDGHLTQ